MEKIDLPTWAGDDWVIKPGREEELEEMSSMAAGNVQGYSGDPLKKKQPTLIREEDDELVEETMNYLLKIMRGGIQ